MSEYTDDSSEIVDIYWSNCIIRVQNDLASILSGVRGALSCDCVSFYRLQYRLYSERAHEWCMSCSGLIPCPGCNPDQPLSGHCARVQRPQWPWPGKNRLFLILQAHLPSGSVCVCLPMDFRWIHSCFSSGYRCTPFLMNKLWLGMKGLYTITILQCSRHKSQKKADLFPCFYVCYFLRVLVNNNSHL